MWRTWVIQNCMVSKSCMLKKKVNGSDQSCMVSNSSLIREKGNGSDLYGLFCWGRKLSKSRRREEGNPEFSSSRNSRKVGKRSTGPVDRRQKQQLGRPDRSTDVHADMHSVAVDRSGRPQDEIGRPGGRPTEVTQLSVGNGRPARSTGV